ncbi:ABC transporter permease [Paenibacillus sp. SC116]|uniref:ABC transporter permease n=1 Tax=Paenibacillus sp. SC116 TaxID=2968986 RepID=UPI00215AFCBE|nr:ABC transporter permease [Paenibacillus sp. SC116]MCR8843364.1 ABC transporter permease [Paenibacillus sp. SC116]
MSYFTALVRNEWMKITSKRQLPYYLIFLLIVLAAAIGLQLWFQSEGSSEVGSVGFTSVIFEITSVFTGIFSIVIASQIITDEFKDGTIKQLLIRPASRTTILMSKLVTIILVVLFVNFAMLIVTALAAFILFDSSVGGINLLWEGTILPFFLTLPNELFYIFVAFTAAVLTRSLGLSISIAVILNSLAGMLSMFIDEKPWYKYTVFPHLDWSPYYKGEPPIEGVTFGFSFGIYALYMLALLLVSILVFKKRDIQ